MKKSTTKILVAALALFMAIGIATGSTFAWFSMNTTVTATGMQVVAKSNSTFLLIKETSQVTGADAAAKAAFIQNGGTPADDTDDNPITVALTVSDGDADLYPAKPYAAGAEATKYPTVAASATAVTTYATAEDAGNWFTANSLDPDKSADNITGDHVLASFTDYVIKKSVTLTIAAGADNAHNLTVTGTIEAKGLGDALTSGTAEAGKTYYSYSAGKYTKEAVEVGVTDVTGFYAKTAGGSDPDEMDITAVKVLVVTEADNMTTLTYAQNGVAQSLYATTDTTLTDSTVVVVDIYIYYDGSEAAVYSNNKANLGWATIDLQFDVAVVTA